MKILNLFLIVFVAVVCFMLPITAAQHAFRTEVKEDKFTVITGAGVASANVQLVKPLYDNDTSSILFLSNDIDDSPVVSSYNSTTRALLVGGLAASTTRTLDVNYE